MARGKGEGSVYKRAGDGMWCVTVELPRGPDDKRRRRTICRKSKPEALKALKAAQAELDAGRLDRGKVPTVKEWFTYWLEQVVPASDSRPSTIRGYRAPVNHHIIPALGRTPLDELRAADVRDLTKRVTSTPKKQVYRLLDPEDIPEGAEYLTGAYAKNVYDILRMGLTAAVAERVIPVHPLEKVKAPSVEVKERRGLTLPQAVKLLEHLAETQHPDRALFLAYLYTGARRGEILGLEVERVGDVMDLSWQLQRISNISDAARSFEYRHLHRHLYLTRPKSKAGTRIVPLVDPLATVLRQHIGTRTGGLVFTGPDGLAENPDRITERWKAALKDAALPSDIVLHGARHTAVTLMYAAGIPEPIIKEIVGHSDIEMTRHYRDPSELAALRDAMMKLSGFIAPPPREVEA